MLPSRYSHHSATPRIQTCCVLTNSTCSAACRLLPRTCFLHCLRLYLLLPELGKRIGQVLVHVQHLRRVPEQVGQGRNRHPWLLKKHFGQTLEL